MHVKRIFRPTVREALAAARAELGPGALVLSTELVPAPGWKGWVGQRIVRLTAASERPDFTEADAPNPAPLDEVVLSEARSAVSSRRHRAPDSHFRDGVIARLVAAGMDRALAEAAVSRMTDAECRKATEPVLRRALTSELESLSSAVDEYERCEVFVGPPGVGKTTTIAKIAAQERVKNNRALNLVSADGFRAGAIEQLRGYAEIMSVPFRAARTADDLSDALASARNPVLVDTAGRSKSDAESAGLLEDLCKRRRVRTHLVLAADTAPATARRVIERYQPLQPSRIVLTKLDEAESVMPLFSVVRELGFPVSYLTAGQRVPEDLARATPASLAALLLGEPALEAQPCH
jgi:flagellar biosynthesis protein FlhF